jgi:lysozyme
MSEGRHMPYADSKGILSIGFGRNLRDRGISGMEAEYLLTNDSVEVLHDLQMALSYWDQLNDARKLVIADLAFNMAAGNIRGFITEFKPTLDVIGHGRYAEAAERMRVWKWYRDVGPRRAEPLIAMMKSGVIVQ